MMIINLSSPILCNNYTTYCAYIINYADINKKKGQNISTFPSNSTSRNNLCQQFRV